MRPITFEALEPEPIAPEPEPAPQPAIPPGWTQWTVAPVSTSSMQNWALLTSGSSYGYWQAVTTTSAPGQQFSADNSPAYTCAFQSSTGGNGYTFDSSGTATITLGESSDSVSLDSVATTQPSFWDHLKWK